MKRLTVFLTVMALFLFLGGTAALAQHGHGGGGGAAGRGPGGAGGPGMSQRPDTMPGPSDRSSRSDTRHDTSRMENKKTPSELLTQNTKLSSRLQGLLPQGANLQDAAKGFKNLGQFVAAVHVSHNLGIPFDQLKATMIGPPPKSLGQAIHQLKPNADANAEAKKANKQAKKDMNETTS